MRTDDRRDRESDSGRKEGEGVNVVKYPGLVEDGMKENQGGSMSTFLLAKVFIEPRMLLKKTQKMNNTQLKTVKEMASTSGLEPLSLPQHTNHTIMSE